MQWNSCVSLLILLSTSRPTEVSFSSFKELILQSSFHTSNPVGRTMVMDVSPWLGAENVMDPERLKKRPPCSDGYCVFPLWLHNYCRKTMERHIMVIKWVKVGVTLSSPWDNFFYRQLWMNNKSKMDRTHTNENITDTGNNLAGKSHQDTWVWQVGRSELDKFWLRNKSAQWHKRFTRDELWVSMKSKGLCKCYR